MVGAPRPPFVDAAYAAELLGVSATEVLEMIRTGQLKSLGGKDKNPFVRTAEVEQIARQMERELAEPPAKRRASQNPVRRVELRLRHDARWNEVSEGDLMEWRRGLDQHTSAAARRVATTAVERLQALLTILDAAPRQR